MSEHPAGYLSADDWSAAQRNVPILCVEAIPVRRVGERVEVGLIQRHNPFGAPPLWCQIGGRVLRGEALIDALRRHLADALDQSPAIAADAQPVYAMEFFPDGPTAGVPWAGTDPRQHSVSLCYPVRLPADVGHREGGEALAFAWFDRAAVDALDTAWPGTRHLVASVLARIA